MMMDACTDDGTHERQYITLKTPAHPHPNCQCVPMCANLQSQWHLHKRERVRGDHGRVCAKLGVDCACEFINLIAGGDVCQTGCVSRANSHIRKSASRYQIYSLTSSYLSLVASEVRMVGSFLLNLLTCQMICFTRVRVFRNDSFDN